MGPCEPRPAQFYLNQVVWPLEGNHGAALGADVAHQVTKPALVIGRAGGGYLGGRGRIIRLRYWTTLPGLCCWSARYPLVKVFFESM